MNPPVEVVKSFGNEDSGRMRTGKGTGQRESIKLEKDQN
jgi:hypothetical protein